MKVVLVPHLMRKFSERCLHLIRDHSNLGANRLLGLPRSWNGLPISRALVMPPRVLDRAS